jgi:hypothetical protein
MELQQNNILKGVTAVTICLMVALSLAGCSKSSSSSATTTGGGTTGGGTTGGGTTTPDVAPAAPAKISIVTPK